MRKSTDRIKNKLRSVVNKCYWLSESDKEKMINELLHIYAFDFRPAVTDEIFEKKIKEILEKG